MRVRKTSWRVVLAWSILGSAACSDDIVPGERPIAMAGASGGLGTADTPAADSGNGASGSVATSDAGATVSQSPTPPRAGSSAPAGAPATPMAGAPGQAGMSAAGPPAADGSGGMTPPGNPPVPSSGCGVTGSPTSGNQSMDVDGTMRAYITRIPANYDPMKPYKLIFAWHGLGGTAMQIAGGFGGGYYGLAQRSMDSAIFISGQGLSAGGSSTGAAGWPNTGGRDVAFVRKLVEFATTTYCIDQSRIFSVGMSYGGIMSNTLGCEMGDVFRAIAPMSGSGPRTFGGRMCVGQVAAWLSHGNADNVVAFSMGQGSRDHWLRTNHCQMQTTPVGPDECVAYEGCDAGFPVHWCEFADGHIVPRFAGDAIWNFFSQF